jgi:hypothetical protein
MLSNNEYSELHHIIPISLGGTDDKQNLVRLSAREHFICHALLAEMYEMGSNEWYKMNHAFMMMKASNSNHYRYFNSRLYDLKRRDFSKVQSFNQSGEKNSQYGKYWMIHPTLNIVKKVSFKESIRLRGIGWDLGRVRRIKKIYKTFKTGIIITKARQDTCIKYFNLDIHDMVGYTELYNLLYLEYVLNDKSTVQLSKQFGLSNVSIRKLLIDFGIGTKNKSGKWDIN